jgi:hypothetical protein
MVRGLFTLGLLKVVDEFFVFVSIVDREFEFSFFGPEDHRLSFHAADHVEGSFGFTAQRHFEQVFLDARFDGFAQLGGDLKKAVCRAKALNALVRPLVVVVTDPEPDAFACRLEAFELGPGEELLPDGLPEPLDLAQRHRMMRPGLEMVRAVLLHLGLETGGAAPVHILPAIVGEHFLGRLIFAGGDAKDLQHVLRRVAAEQIGSHDETGVIVHEGDEVGVTATQPEGEDVGLPHLIGSSPLKEAGPHHVLRRFGPSFLHQALSLERLAHRRRAGLQEEHPLEQLRDPLDPAGRFLLLEFDDLLANRFGEFGSRLDRSVVLESLFALLSIALGPFVDGGVAEAQFAGDHLLGETLFEVEFDRAETFLKSECHTFSRRSAPRGGGGVGPLLL